MKFGLERVETVVRAPLVGDVVVNYCLLETFFVAFCMVLSTKEHSIGNIKTCC
jgi:hypothetical protein